MRLRAAASGLCCLLPRVHDCRFKFWSPLQPITTSICGSCASPRAGPDEVLGTVSEDQMEGCLLGQRLAFLSWDRREPGVLRGQICL